MRRADIASARSQFTSLYVYFIGVRRDYDRRDHGPNRSYGPNPGQSAIRAGRDRTRSGTLSSSGPIRNSAWLLPALRLDCFCRAHELHGDNVLSPFRPGAGSRFAHRLPPEALWQTSTPPLVPSQQSRFLTLNGSFRRPSSQVCVLRYGTSP